MRLPRGNTAFAEDDGVDYLARGETLLIATTDVAIVGLHNQANALAALAAGELLGLEMPAMLQVLSEFPGPGASHAVCCSQRRR